METTTPENGLGSDLPSRIFTQFIAALTAQGIPAEVVAQMSQVLLVDKNLTEASLRSALMAQAPPL